MEYQRKKKGFLLCFAVLWLLQMAAAFWFCTKKQGFHEDEYYTYYSTARTNGFYVEDGKWMERDTYRNEFVVLPGQQFQYGLVRQVQSWDVHPPMYYWVFHTIASLTPGAFSKWTGLSVNLFFRGINLILLTYLSYLIAGGEDKLPLLVTFVYGFTPAAMSGVVFIRMYEMLTAFVLLCAVLHVRAVKKNREKLSVLRELAPMAAVTYMGFLTHYYYFLFLFFIAAVFAIWLLRRDRKLRNCLRYGLFQAAAFALAYLTYPVFPAQMFRGHRGAQAAESFFELSNTLERLCFFADLANRYVFGGLLGIMLLFIAAAAAYLLAVGKKRGALCRRTGTGAEDGGLGAPYGMLLTASAGYFLAVSKTALLLGETSVRYQLPIYGIIVLLVFSAVRELWRRGVDLAGKSAGLAGRKNAGRYKNGAKLSAVVICVVLTAAGYRCSDVVFLYPEDAAQTAFAKERAENGVPAVYLYHPGEEWCIWDVTDELLAYPAVYFAAADGIGQITDGQLAQAEALVVYVAKGADEKAWLSRLPGEAGVSAYEEPQPVFTEKYCDVYDLRR